MVSTSPQTKGKGSPDSVPSLATTSVASSEAESDDHMSPRILFMHSNNSTRREVAENIQRVIDRKNSMIEEKHGGATALSISSSESMHSMKTVVASWNLSPSALNDDRNIKSKAATTIGASKEKITISTVSQHFSDDDDDDDEDAMNDSVGAFPTSEMRKLNKTPIGVVDTSKSSHKIGISPIATMKDPSIIIEDPPKSTFTCNRAAMSMTPKQFSDIFNSFDGKKTIFSMREQYEQYTTQDPSDAHKGEASLSPTTMSVDTVRSTAARWMDGWMPQNEALEREHEALKEVLEDNSTKLLNLREAVETQRALNALKEVEIEDKEKELQSMRGQLEDLSHQKELFVQREQEFLETIEELTDKFDNLVEMNCYPANQTKESRKVVNDTVELEPFDEPKARVYTDFEHAPFDEAEDRASIIRRQDSIISGLRHTLKVRDKEYCLLRKRLDTTMEEIATYVTREEESKDSLSLNEPDEAESDNEHEDLEGDLEVGTQKEETRGIETAETAVDEDSVMTVVDEQSVKTVVDEDSESTTMDEENTPPSPTGLVSEMRKKLEMKDVELEMATSTRAYQSGPISAFRRPLEQKGLKPQRRERSPTPVSESSTEAEEVALSPNPVLHTRNPQSFSAASEDLLGVITSISKRLDAVEAESRASSCSQVSCKAKCEFDALGLERQGSDEVRIDMDEIEVMLEGQVYGNLDARRQRMDEKLSSEDESESCCCWNASVTDDLD